ncbi:hypothetical protein ACFP81_12015 [Deinococcus lacus]|uniref:DUF2262 domain-containing protein n=1 Tax=Deinococcus lacus TaxID=392561 RepID=A0ABW1YEA9_9DEIO
MRDLDKGMQYLMQHPVARERGELKETYRVTTFPEGLTTIDPEPPAELLRVMEDIAREVHGRTEADWAAAHEQMMADLGWYDAAGGEKADQTESREVPQGVPAARRLSLELREPAPLDTPFTAPLGVWGEYVLTLAPGSLGFSLDEEKWYLYADPEAEATDNELSEFLATLLNSSTVPVTVWADGRIEWEGDEVPAEHAERVRRDLQAATGAGDAAAWARFSHDTLADVYEEAAPYLRSAATEQLPVAAALKLDVPIEVIEDAEHPSKLFFESEVTFDGETWHDLFLEEPPAELLALKPSAE